MVQGEKRRWFVHTLLDAVLYIPNLLSAVVLPSIEEGTQMVMNTIEDKFMQIEKKIMRRISSLLVLWLGGLFLLFSLFFFLIEYVGLSNAAAFFSIGIVVFVTGLVLKLRE